MPTTPEQFDQRRAAIRHRLGDQGRMVRRMVELAFESIYTRDAELGMKVAAMDDTVDTADLAIEQMAVDLLTEAARESCQLTPRQLRGVLSSVKVNNEFERIADAASEIAERVVQLSDRNTPLPRTTQMLTNSVVGIIAQTVEAFEQIDPEHARQVLASEEIVLQFKSVILRDAEQRVADGRMGVDLAFDLVEIVTQAVVMADHCTNVAEQVIYESTGAIVRHHDGGWDDLDLGKSGSAQ